MISLDRLEIPNLGFSRIFVIARIRYENRCELNKHSIQPSSIGPPLTRTLQAGTCRGARGFARPQAAGGAMEAWGGQRGTSVDIAVVCN